MNQHEFLAWLEGFSAALNGAAPTLEQWKQVLTKADQLKSPLKSSVFGGARDMKLGPAIAELNQIPRNVPAVGKIVQVDPAKFPS